MRSNIATVLRTSAATMLRPPSYGLRHAPHLFALPKTALIPVISAVRLPSNGRAPHVQMSTKPNDDSFFGIEPWQQRDFPMMSRSLNPFFGFHSDLFDELHAELSEKMSSTPLPGEWTDEDNNLCSKMRIGKGWNEATLQAEISADGRELTVSGVRETDHMKHQVESLTTLPFKVDDVNKLKLEYRADEGVLIARLPKEFAEAQPAGSQATEQSKIADKLSALQIEQEKLVQQDLEALPDSSDEGRRVPITSSSAFTPGWHEADKTLHCSVRVGKNISQENLHAELSPDGREVTISAKWDKGEVKQAVHSSMTLPYTLADASKLQLQYDAKVGTVKIAVPKPAAENVKPSKIHIKMASA